jgi:hypothetical protein
VKPFPETGALWDRIIPTLMDGTPGEKEYDV